MNNKKKTYLDCAATSFPKPEAVYRTIERFAREVGIGNNRGSYREGRESADIIRRARDGIGRILHAAPREIVFSSGATESLNILLFGLLREGDHVIISPFEHNAVTRPLKYLAEQRGISVTQLPGSLRAGIDPDDVKKSILPQTRLCVVSHISNAFGGVAPIREIGFLLREFDEVVFAVDGAQSAGTLPLDVESLGIDFFAFAGHKGLLGPTGTGGFFIREELVKDVLPLKFGGTGFRSGEGTFIAELPYKYEVGTQNTWGIAGLGAGVEFINEKGVPNISSRILRLTRKAVAGLEKITGLTLYLPGKTEHHGVVSFNLRSLPARDTASLLDRIFNIKVRAGIHCSPEGHRTAGTYPAGTVRASFGIFTTEEEIDYFCASLGELVQSVGGSVG